ncbi:hypothetical protein CGCS363_v011943 [Colletotrichum siamense]|uniref:uncharacterized protein n=1 Tax=Colletotrichum siamense TaxID=690259 RepID=UPI001872EF00|nr:uncharacterized protein CGCS363_v011943 [Colletotrichum siamense]KAF5489166.1 hypothetical protein CGCS363_v011943 [Colletotrichum siamense]
MGRLQPSVGQPPASFRKAARAKKAKVTLNQLIPSLLPTHPRARKGIDTAELIVEPKPAKKQLDTSKDGSARPLEADSPPSVVLRVADTLTAAHSLISDRPGEGRVAILNMASPLTPGGGFINGAGSQEESLCMRCTLLPSLKDEWYRLPELGAIYTPDVLVFRGEDSDEVLEKKERWFVDCISAAMLRNPETYRDEATGFSSYVNYTDRQLVLEKMKMVLRICQARGVKKVVLGAWGCGAFGNPVGEVASAWKKVLLPRNDNKGKKKGNKETWNDIDKVVFAIKDAGMADAFEAAFGKGLTREEADESGDEDESEVDPEEANRAELQERIRELEERIEKTVKAQLKEGLRGILAGLESQLPSKERGNAADEVSEEKSEEESEEEEY